MTTLSLEASVVRVLRNGWQAIVTVRVGGMYAWSQASPVVWTDRERARAEANDLIASICHRA
jgi:hypothetical protein